MGRRVLVIGAGIIGTHCALHIRDSMPDATICVVDRAPFDYQGSSCGNMGGFASCEVQPLATIRNIFRGLGWMWQPLAPFTLRPSCLRSLRPWLGRFVRSALTPGHSEHVISAQQALMTNAESAHREALRGTGLEELISSEGALVIYKNKHRLEADWNSRWRLFRERGEDCNRLDRDELSNRLPELSEAIQHAVHVPAIRHWRSPTSLLQGLHDVIQARGVEIRSSEVVEIKRNDQFATSLRLGNGKEEVFDELVVSAGAWSKTLCADIGDHVPLDSERGYSTTVENSGVNVSNLLLFPDDEFVATPMQEGLRLGGTVELASIDAEPDFRRTKVLSEAIRDYFPSINTDHRDDWMGHRPSVPDGLPVIGRSPRCPNVYYAFGHGHVGVTQSAITGRLIAQQLRSADAEIDLAAYSISRFK